MEWFRILQVPLFCLAIAAHTGWGVVLVQESSSFTLPFEHAAGTSFFHLVALDETSGTRAQNPLFQVLRTSAFWTEARSGRGLFTIDSRSGALMVSPHRRHSLSEYRGFIFALDVVASPSEFTADRKRGLATVVVTVSNETATCRPSPELCFHSSPIFIRLPETAKMGTFVGTLKPTTYQKLCPQSHTVYSILDEGAPLRVSSETGDLTVSSELNFEENTTFEWDVSCSVDSKGEQETFTAKVHLTVEDVDDNPPRPQNSTLTTIQIDADDVIPGEPIPAQFTVLDRDSSTVNNISVGLLDPLNLFSLRDPVVFHGVGGVHTLVNAVVVATSPFQFSGTSYNASVIFEDRGLVSGKDNKVIFRIEVYNHSHLHSEPELPELYQVETTVFRRTSKHSRVIQPMEVHEHAGYFFRLAATTRDFLDGRIFGVTPSTGIIYVKDEVSLSRFLGDVIRLELTWRNKRVADRQCKIAVHVLDAGDLSESCGIEPGRHFNTCALHGTEEECESNCGRGAIQGFCHWRRPPLSTSPSSLFATCSPELDTCPDGQCDELERKDPLICPQDCASKVQGEAFRRASGKGVGLSAAPCVCDGRGTCTCVRIRPEPVVNASKPQPRKKHLDTPPHEPEAIRKDDWNMCNAGCKAMISGVSLVMMMLVATAGYAVYRQLKCGSRKEVVDPLTMADVVVTTEFAEERAILQAETTSEDLASVDRKLEYPRDRLVLGETLGEGEFGRVVKAKATDIAGMSGEVTVAVKMLKENATNLEEQDLLSELNLMKEVSHPNVIRLLGACTTKGQPLYLIVEYAEHGALRNYLRMQRSEDSEKLQQELLSFAWQIAKGMTYLADMKLVHRDLAARNVLLATGKKIKISDFGLSRDVYVADTYLKTTQGRVPVKWMAIESLADHVYTTKSDVWSFGVVLWEIIRLGATPYPGIGPEKLYHLLKGGYRMSKPENCSQELYRIMVSCWREVPKERPSFKEIAQRLETLLHETVEYLPLGSGLKQTIAVFETDRKNSSQCDQLNKIQRLTFSIRSDQYENRRLLSSDDYADSV